MLSTLYHSWSITRLQRWKSSYHTNGLTTQINWTTKKIVSKGRLSQKNYEIAIIAILQKKIFSTTRNWFVEYWGKVLPWSKWDSVKFHLLEQRAIPTWKSVVSGKNANSTDFLFGTITETLFQHSRLCRKWSSFITTKATKVLIFSSLHVHYLTCPTLVCTFLPVWNSVKY